MRCNERGRSRPHSLELYVDGWSHASRTAAAASTSDLFGIYRWGWGFWRVTFVLAEVPIAAVKTRLQRRELPPPLVDELIAKTYYAIVGGGDIGGNADDSRLNTLVGRKR
jgi:hypothetical protein